jgi:hypothetical protein
VIAKYAADADEQVRAANHHLLHERTNQHDRCHDGKHVTGLALPAQPTLGEKRPQLARDVGAGVNDNRERTREARWHREVLDRRVLVDEVIWLVAVAPSDHAAKLQRREHAGSHPTRKC